MSGVAAQPRRQSPWRDRIVTAEWVYGTVLVMALIAATGPDDPDVAGTTDDAQNALAVVVGTVVVFWIAHAYAEAVARYGRADHDGGMGAAIVAAARHSLGLLAAAVLPCVPLAVASSGAMSYDDASDLSLWIGLAVLAVSSAWSFLVRGARWWVTVLGTITTVLIGFIVVLLDFLLHEL